MVGNGKLQFPTDNIRSLLNETIVALDRRLRELREGSRYQDVRNSDVKVFMRAFRSSATVSEIARSLDVTRQAVHASVKRLVALKVLELQPIPHNSRDKLVVVTERGRHAEQTALDQIKTIEAQMAAAIGKNELKLLRKQLRMINDCLKPPA
jgi:DNA-binding MarR family transcriptional regulator